MRSPVSFSGRARALVALAVALLALSPPGVAGAATGSRFRPAATGSNGAVATASPIASAVAIDVLEKGGNAVDAAIAAVFAIGVVRPEMCGIGGGGFLVYRGADGTTGALDFRERAPLDGYTYSTGMVGGNGVALFGVGHNVIGVPGTVAGMAAAAERYASLPWADLVDPARVLAATGFPVSPTTAAEMRARGNVMRFFPESARVYLKAGVAPYDAGDTLVLPDYAWSLGQIQHDPASFYTGEIARRIVAEMQRPSPYPGDAGALSAADLAAYEAKWREPLSGSYRNHQLVAMPPPTSGGITTIETLNLLEGFDLDGFGQLSADHLHVLAEAQKIAWADRRRYIGDPDHVTVPAFLTSKRYADSRRTDIDMDAAREPQPGTAPTSVGSHTTHLSVIDGAGNAVAVTCTIEQVFGSGVVAQGTGFLLNNQLTDFDPPNSGSPNEPAPGKRPRSSMSPTIVVRQGRPVLAVGGAGGSRIIMGTVQVISNVIDFGLDVAAAIDEPRLDARCPADEVGPTVCIEDARIAPDVLAELERRGHRLSRQGEYGPTPIMNAAAMTGRRAFAAASEPRAPAEEWGGMTS
jgi:gamma-glutamyltranspeptidase/glutathione hydrolase